MLGCGCWQRGCPRCSPGTPVPGEAGQPKVGIRGIGPQRISRSARHSGRGRLRQAASSGLMDFESRSEVLPRGRWAWCDRPEPRRPSRPTTDSRARTRLCPGRGGERRRNGALASGVIGPARDCGTAIEPGGASGRCGPGRQPERNVAWPWIGPPPAGVGSPGESRTRVPLHCSPIDVWRG